MLKLSVAFVTLATFAQAAHYKRVACPDGINTATNAACCAFFSLRDDLQSKIFQNECGEDAHEILRLAFHDAIGFSLSGKFAGGGADGSMIVFDDPETGFPSNAGIDDSVDTLNTIAPDHPDITPGDLIQFAAAVGITNCAGAPQLEFLAGRPPPKVAADDGTVPDPFNSVDEIFARITDAGLAEEDMVNLLVSHTIARADHVDPTLEGVPFDSTPFTFDTQFFLETMLKGDGFPGTGNNTGEVESAIAAEGGMRLQSDFEFAQDPRTACQWQSFVNNQQLMMSAFKKSMAKMAVIGQDVSSLIDCSEVIPVPVPPNGKPATFPATKTQDDVLQVCVDPFPVLSTDPGEVTRIPACPDGSTDPADC